MEEKSKKPKIRFKGFTEAWEQRKLGEYGDFTYGHSAPKWSVTSDATTPCVRYGELYTKFGVKIDKVFSHTNMPHNKLVFSKGTEVLIPRVGEDPYDYNHCTWLSIPNVAIGEMISIYYTKQNPLFTAIMYNATLRNEFAIRVEGGSVTNLYYEKLKDIDVAFPKKEEQEKISQFFYKIDNLITLHQRKYDKLVNVKKSLLEKMFPKNDSNIPEIRFKGFTEAWEQRKLFEMSNVFDGTHQTPDYKDKGVMFLSVENIKTLQSEKYISKEDFVKNFKNYPEKNDILMTRIGDIGTPNIVKDNTPKAYYVSLALIKPTKINSSYLNIAIQSNFVQKGIKQRSLLTAIPMKINKDQIGQVEIQYPTDSKEQEKIGGLFKNIDNLITLHQRKLEKLKNIKKSLLEKMFI